MGTNSKIEYVNHSLGLWIGCTPLPRPGCENCYGESGMRRWGLYPHKVVRTSKATWRQPLVKERATGQYKWKSGDYIFVCSWSDFFHPKADKWRTEAWSLMRHRPDLNWVIVTKRIEQARCWMPLNWDWPNRILVLSVENQKIADSEIPKLLSLKPQFPNVTLAVSIEPMLGAVDLFRVSTGKIICRQKMTFNSLSLKGGIGFKNGGVSLGWIIIGCESINGSLGRECKLEWIESVVEQCKAAGVPVFVKQIPLKGKLVKDIKLFPKELQLQEYPNEQ